MSQYIGICPACAEKVKQCYNLAEMDDDRRCCYCGRDGKLYSFSPKKRSQAARPTVSRGRDYEAEQRVKRRSWA